MRFLLAPIGSVGDVNPYLGIGRELVRRGHSVTVVTSRSFAPMVERAGLAFLALQGVADFEQFAGNPDIWRFTKGWKLALQWGAVGPMRTLYRAIAERYVPGETVVAGPGMAFGARLAHEKLGVPLATLHLEPDKIRSTYCTAVMPPPLVLSDWVPRVSKRCQLWIADRFFVDPCVGPRLNAFRGELGLPPVRRVVADWWHSPQRVIGLFPAWYAPPQPDWPRQTVLTDFPLWDFQSVAPVSPEVQEFLAAGEPPVLFTAGSGHRFAGPFFQAALECCRRLGCRGILITKYRDQVPRDLPAGVRCFAYVPFGYLLRRSAAMVSHGGVGTTSIGMAAGIPQVLVPMSFNQPDDAARVARLGCGIALRRGTFCGRAMARSIERLLSSPETKRRCREVAAWLAQSRAIDHTADLLEELLGTDVRRRRLGQTRQAVGQRATRQSAA
jgi:rhamnosyltransferase subunit B